MIVQIRFEHEDKQSLSIGPSQAITKDGTKRWVLVSGTMNCKIQIVTDTFMVNEGHSKGINFGVHGSRNKNSPCGAPLKIFQCGIHEVGPEDRNVTFLRMTMTM